MYFTLSQVGKAELDALVIGPSQCASGFTRAGFLFAQMDSASTLPASQYTIDHLPDRRSRAEWCLNLARASGFCHLKLFTYEWVVPALCVLGAFPDVSDVARLSPYFQLDHPLDSWGLYSTGFCRGCKVLHIVGANRSLPRDIESQLRSNTGSVVGSAFPRLPSLPPRPAPPPVASRSLPPHPPMPHDADQVYSARAQSRAPGGQGGKGRRQQDRYFEGSGDLPHCPFNKKQNNYVPFQPYSTNAGFRRRGSPSATAQACKSATHDELDDAIESLKSELPRLPSQFSRPLWNNFLSWFQELKKNSKPFSRSATIQEARSHFSSLFDAALDAAKHAEHTATSLSSDLLEAKGMELSRLSSLVSRLEEDIVNPPIGSDPADIEQALLDACAQLSSLDDEINTMEAEAVPPSLAEGSIADGVDFVPVEVAPEVIPWPESNFEDYLARTAPLFPAPSGKVPLDSLLVRMEEKSDSKILLPRPLELYSEDEINSAKPKSRTPWLNRHEDPLEAVKSWSVETFTHVYSQPGFHFMVARTAQNGPQSCDPKLPTLRSRLSARWDCPVEFMAMLPCQDWMLCMIPDVSGRRAEILTTALMRLSDGNASYVVRHFSAVSRTRDLTFTVKGSRDDGSSVYNQLRKRLLEFESRGVRLGWRVLGERKTNAPFVFWVPSSSSHCPFFGHGLWASITLTAPLIL